MSRREPPEPDVSVRQRVDVTLSAKEVLHALRCWIDHGPPRTAHRVPAAKSFSETYVSVHCDDEGNLLSAVATYEPADPQPEPMTDKRRAEMGLAMAYEELLVQANADGLEKPQNVGELRDDGVVWVHGHINLERLVGMALSA
jgi:hypothetical protein